MATNELASQDPLLLTQFSPRAVGSDGNCFCRAASLGLYGAEEHHYFLRTRTALEIMNNRSLYDVDSPEFVLPTGPSSTCSFREVLRSSLTDGNYAELVHLFALSTALNITIQSYCCPDIANLHIRDDGLHPYTIRISDNKHSHTMSSEQLVLMWTRTRINVCEPNHFVLLAQRFQHRSPTTVIVGGKRKRCSAVRYDAETSAQGSSAGVNNNAPSINDKRPERKRKLCTELRGQQSMPPTCQLNIANSVVNNQPEKRLSAFFRSSTIVDVTSDSRKPQL